MRVGRGGPDGQTLTRIAWPNNIKSSLAGFSDSRPAFPGDCVQRIAAYHCGRRAEQARPLGGAFRRRTEQLHSQFKRIQSIAKTSAWADGLSDSTFAYFSLRRAHAARARLAHAL